MRAFQPPRNEERMLHYDFATLRAIEVREASHEAMRDDAPADECQVTRA
jgi:hypothetical protein